MPCPLLRRRLALPAIALAVLTACGGELKDFPGPGRLLVEVRDEAQAPVADVLLELRTPDLQLVWRSARTGSDGRVEIGQADGGVLPGEYRLVPRPPAGYTLAPGQSDAVPVTVVEHQTVSVLIVLRRGG